MAAAIIARGGIKVVEQQLITAAGIPEGRLGLQSLTPAEISLLDVTVNVNGARRQTLSLPR